MNSSRESLEQLLPVWRVQPRRDPQFRAQVWERIAEAQRTGAVPVSWTGFARGHAAMVVGALALALVAGAIGGRSQARARVAAESARIATAYVQSLDARSMAMR